MGYYIFHSRDISDEFIFRSEHGILSNWYPSGELMPFKGSVPFPYNKDHSKLPTITQRRKAAQTGRDKQIRNLQISQRNL